MNGAIIPAFAAVMLLVALFPIQSAYSQFQQGGVDHPGTWHVGEGLKKGDLFSYNMCFAGYKECTEFQMDIWVEGDVQDGSETKWLTQVVVRDGSKIAKGEMMLSKVATEPAGGSDEIGTYSSAFKSSIVWLSAFANAHDPKAFRDVSWGKIGNIGGEQVAPQEIIDGGLTVTADHFDEVIQVGWRTGGYSSKIYVADDFPFPIRASTWQHVSEGIPPPEYNFELISYQRGVGSDPFVDVLSTMQEQAAQGCPVVDDLDTSVKRITKDGKYLLHIFYAPGTPIQECEMKWQINFLNKFDETEFLALVQYDIVVVDENDNVVRSLAQEDGRLFLFSPSGLATLDVAVKEDPGMARYAVLIYGLSPESIPPNTTRDWLYLDIMVDPPKDTAGPSIPAWIKSTVEFWTQGVTSDAEFISAIQYLIDNGIIVVPPTEAGSESSTIPSWIKSTAQYWVEGVTSDAEFISAIQYLIVVGIITV